MGMPLISSVFTDACSSGYRRSAYCQRQLESVQGRGRLEKNVMRFLLRFTSK